MRNVRPRRWPISALLLLLLAACGTAQPVSLGATETPPPVTTEVSVLPGEPAATPEASTIPAEPVVTPGATDLPVTPSSEPDFSPIPTIAVPTPVIPAALLTPVASPPAPDLQFSGESALGFVRDQMQWVPRHTGTPGWQQTGDYIVQQLSLSGWSVEEQRFEYQGVNARNIIAKRGSGPVLILGAHYDTRKYADRDPDETRRQDPVPGASDGASGVAVLLELARHIDPDKLGREVWLTFFDAEDNGDIEGWDWIAGSSYMAQNLTITPEAMILLDMVGDADLQLYYEVNSNDLLKQSIWQTAAELGYKQFIPELRHAMLDDHTPFLERNIPAVDLIDFDYPPWHTVGDTTDKVSAESLEAVGRTMERWLETRAQP
ncbi:MAG TPA: M28 family peptidase [Herpetosiphonaceae bacterium]